LGVSIMQRPRRCESSAGQYLETANEGREAVSRDTRRLLHRRAGTSLAEIEALPQEKMDRLLPGLMIARRAVKDAAGG
jgi:hypothetical protein